MLQYDNFSHSSEIFVLEWGAWSCVQPLIHSFIQCWSLLGVQKQITWLHLCPRQASFWLNIQKSSSQHTSGQDHLQPQKVLVGQPAVKGWAGGGRLLHKVTRKNQHEGETWSVTSGALEVEIKLPHSYSHFFNNLFYHLLNSWRWDSDLWLLGSKDESVQIFASDEFSGEIQRLSWGLELQWISMGTRGKETELRLTPHLLCWRPRTLCDLLRNYFQGNGSKSICR